MPVTERAQPTCMHARLKVAGTVDFGDILQQIPQHACRRGGKQAAVCAPKQTERVVIWHNHLLYIAVTLVHPRLGVSVEVRRFMADWHWEPTQALHTPVCMSCCPCRSTTAMAMRAAYVSQLACSFLI